MKKIFVSVFSAILLSAALNAQVVEFTDIQINTETQNVVYKRDPIEPLPHFFLNGGVNVCGGIGGFGKVGWYKVHGVYAGLMLKEGTKSVSSYTSKYGEAKDRYSKSTMVDDACSRLTATVGYIYNVPFSLTDGYDRGNCMQLMCGIGYGKHTTLWKYYSNKTTKYYLADNCSGFAIEPALMLRLGWFNWIFGGSFILGKTCLASFQTGIGFTFGNKKSKQQEAALKAKASQSR